MIQKYVFIGDTHGVNVSIIKKIRRMYKNYAPHEIGVIILGDAGFNTNRPEEDNKWKHAVNKIGVQVYCVRGNHDACPDKLEGINVVFDDNVQNLVFEERNFPNIHYLQDGTFYYFAGMKVLVVGGAYSVDKHYRLENGWFWEPDEQLSETERENIFNKVEGKHFDLVLSHTCPLSWQPTDLFLDFVDQSTVDNSMEVWLEKLKEHIHFDVWLFGHYHDDRLVRPGVQMLYNEPVSYETLVSRWFEEDPSYMIGAKKDPKYYWD